MFGEAFAMQDAGLPRLFLLGRFFVVTAAERSSALEFRQEQRVVDGAGGLPCSSQVQVPTVARKRPGRLDLDQKNALRREHQQVDLRWMLPSSTTKSKLAPSHARARSPGTVSRTNSNASRFPRKAGFVRTFCSR